jgi:hypothetical protein
MRPVAALAVAVPAAGIAGYAVVVHHVGAPQLPWTCPADGDTVHRWWVSGNGPAGISSLEETHWAGSTEVVGCSTDLTARLGTVPHQGLAESLLDRFVYGTHVHNLMGALTGLYDQPDGKWVFAVAAMLIVLLVLRVLRVLRVRRGRTA